MNSRGGYLRSASVHVAAGAILCCAGVQGLSKPLQGWVGPSSASAPLSASVATTRTEFGQRTAPAIRIVDSIDETRLVKLNGNTHPLARADFDKGRVSRDLPMGDLILKTAVENLHQHPASGLGTSESRCFVTVPHRLSPTHKE